ncbi:MAG: APC family permease [Actinomycetales bacterium]
MTNPDASRHESVDVSEAINRRDQHQLRAGQLGTVAIAFFVISAAAPLTGMAGGAPFAMLLGNGPGVPFSYLVVTVLMLIFAVGYVAMARHHTSAGAFYSYVARAMGGYAGGAAAWVALLGYNAMQIGLYGLWGVASAGFLSSAFGVNVPWWLLSYLAMALIGVCGYRQIDLSLKVLGVLVAAEFAIVIAFDVMVLIKGGSGGTGGLSASSFTWESISSGAPAIGLLFAAASFVGFEATTLYSEEAKDPARTVPRATYLAVLTIGLFFMLTSWLMVNSYGDDATLVAFLGGSELGDPTNFLFAMAGPYIGHFLTDYVMSFLFASSLFAALLAFHNAVARYAYALGREGLVPERLGRTHPMHLSPHMGSVSQSVLAFVVVTVFVVLGMDPAATLFTWLTQLGTLAISYLMATAAIAVFVFFRTHKHLDQNPLHTAVAPAVAALGLLTVAVYATSQFGFLIGDPESPLAWALPALIPTAALIGVISAAVLRSREPQAFALMGRDRQLQLHE